MTMEPMNYEKCGTPANYKAHYRHNEKPCVACIRAEHERRRRYKKAQFAASETRVGKPQRYYGPTPSEHFDWDAAIVRFKKMLKEVYG